MSHHILKTENLSRTVSIDSSEKEIINDFSFIFNHSQIYTVIGPSGSGKSSLLRLLNRLDEPTSGMITYKNKNYTEYSPCELRKMIGYLFQTPHMFEKTIADNLLLAHANLSESEMLSILDLVHLPQAMLSKEVDRLSGGEKQRVALARLLATNPEIILLDEPTSALDPAFTEAIEQLIVEIVKQENLTAIVVTHHPDQALRIGQFALLMNQGQLIEHGTVDDVINHPQSEIGRKYKAKEIQ